MNKLPAADEALAVDVAYNLGEISREERSKLLDDLEPRLYREMYDVGLQNGCRLTMTGWCLTHCHLRSVDDTVSNYSLVNN